MRLKKIALFFNFAVLVFQSPAQSGCRKCIQDRRMIFFTNYSTDTVTVQYRVKPIKKLMPKVHDRYYLDNYDKEGFLTIETSYLEPYTIERGADWTSTSMDWCHYGKFKIITTKNHKKVKIRYYSAWHFLCNKKGSFAIL